MTPKEEFTRLREAAQAARQAHFENSGLEPYLLEILDLVKSHPGAREEFIRAFIDIATWKVSAPYDTVPFCMRELKFPEVLEAVGDHYESLRRAGRHGLYMNYCSSVSHAYGDFVWEDALCWNYYASQELVPDMVPSLIERLTLQDHVAQFNAVRALRFIGTSAKAAVPALKALLDNATEAGDNNLMGAIRLAIDAIHGGEIGG